MEQKIQSLHEFNTVETVQILLAWIFALVYDEAFEGNRKMNFIVYLLKICLWICSLTELRSTDSETIWDWDDELQHIKPHIFKTVFRCISSVALC